MRNDLRVRKKYGCNTTELRTEKNSTFSTERKHYFFGGVNVFKVFRVTSKKFKRQPVSPISAYAKKFRQKYNENLKNKNLKN